MYCQKCGVQLDADAQFCKACGTAIMTTPQPCAPVYQQPAKQTNNLALIGLILSVCMPIVGLVLSIIARRQCIQRGEDGEKMARAGIIVGAVFSGILLVIILAALAIPFIILSPMFDAPAIMPDMPGMM